MGADYTKDYFEYKMVRTIATSIAVVLLSIIGGIVAGAYIDRMKAPAPNEYTVQLKYLEMGYIQRGCGKCSAAWLKADVPIKCDIDGKECK
jgi:hypothetical protein